MFFYGFSGIEPGTLFTHDEVAQTLGIGLRFDLRTALLILLPVAVLLWLPCWNLISVRALRWLARGYLIVALAILTMIHIVDFGHYAYLGVRLNASVLRYGGCADFPGHALADLSSAVDHCRLAAYCRGARLGVDQA